MSIFDSVFSEVTKWLLGKVDKKLNRSSSSYKNEVLKLYDCLYNIAEYIEKDPGYIISSLLPPWFRHVPYKDITKLDLDDEYQEFKDSKGLLIGYDRYEKAVFFL